MYKTIPNFSYYKISDRGEIVSYIQNKKGRTIKPLYNEAYKYYSIYLTSDEGERVHCLVHRLVATTFLTNDTNLPCVNHKDGDKLNNFVDNLEWCTYSDNQKHAYALGLKSNSGENNPLSILSEEDVLNIYDRLLSGERNCDLAKLYGVSTCTISDIKHKRNWNYLTNDLPDVKVVRRKEKLSSATVEWVCKLLEDGKSTKEILELSKNKSLDENKIYDIKRRRSFKYISENYNF